MYFKANYKDIDETGKYFTEKSEEINSKVNNINSLLKELNKHWNGYDYDELKRSYDKYNSQVSVLSKKINDIGNALRKASLTYYHANINFGKNVKSMRKDKDE